MKLGKYRHYKGNFYYVLGVVLQTETREKLVLYRALYPCSELWEEYGEDPLFVRPFEMFYERVMVDGVVVPRFEWVGE